MITNHHSPYALLRYKECITRNMTKSWYFSSSEADIFLSETWVGGSVLSQWKNMNWRVIIYLSFVGIFETFCQKIPYCPFHFLVSQLSFQLCLFSDWQGNYEILSWGFFICFLVLFRFPPMKTSCACWSFKVCFTMEPSCSLCCQH